MQTDNKSIGERIKQIREGANMTQDQVGKLVGVEKATVSKYEYGDTKLSPVSLAIIAKIGNTTTDWIITGEGFGPGESKGHNYTNETPANFDTSNINTNRLKEVVLMLEWYLSETNTKDLDPELRAEITVKMYDFYTDSNEEVGEQSFRRLMRLAT